MILHLFASNPTCNFGFNQVKVKSPLMLVYQLYNLKLLWFRYLFTILDYDFALIKQKFKWLVNSSLIEMVKICDISFFLSFQYNLLCLLHINWEELIECHKYFVKHLICKWGRGNLTFIVANCPGLIWLIKENKSVNNLCEALIGPRLAYLT